MTKFIIDIDEEELSDVTKKEIEEIIKELKPGTIKMIYQVIKGNLVEFYVRANRKGDVFVTKPGLTDADKKWIADLVVSTVKPIQEDIKILKEDVKNLKEDVKAIKECPTIKKELNKK